MIDGICCDYNCYKPRMYRENARRDYLNLAKCKKRTAKKIRKAIKQQLQYMRRDFGCVEALLSDGVKLSKKQLMRYMVLKQVYEQQQYMYESQVHTVPDRIVSISQPYIRLIVRGKAVAPVEFGAKLDLSIDENGMVRLGKLSFDVYNESGVLIGAIERYRECTVPTTIRKEPWRIRFTGTVIIWHTVSCMTSGYPGRGLYGQRKML